jgi:hypothetical protein
LVITPTDKGALVAGAGIWTLLWASITKIDAVPLLNRFISRDKIFGWVRNNKSVTLLCTEAVNFGAHGISRPDSALFALGGTVVNAVMVFIVLPVFGQSTERKLKQSLLKGESV